MAWRVGRNTQRVSNMKAIVPVITSGLDRSAWLAFSKVAAEAVQIHGGIAITWESDIQLYFKRAHGSAQLLGPPRQQLRRLESKVF